MPRASRPIYDTGWRVGMPAYSQKRKHPLLQEHTIQITGLDGRVHEVIFRGLGLLAVEQNGMLDGREYAPSTPLRLAESMNHIAHKNSTGVHHWVTNGEIHWAFISINRETDAISILDHGLLLC